CRGGFGGADGLLRGLDRLCAHYGSTVRRLAQSVRQRRSAEFEVGSPRLVLAAAVSDADHLLRLGTRRNQPTAIRSGRGGVRVGLRLRGRQWLDTLHEHVGGAM